jgi:hypothetical protein
MNYWHLARIFIFFFGGGENKWSSLEIREGNYKGVMVGPGGSWKQRGGFSYFNCMLIVIAIVLMYIFFHFGDSICHAFPCLLLSPKHQQ